MINRPTQTIMRVVSAFGPLTKNIRAPREFKGSSELALPANGHAFTATTLFNNGTDVKIIKSIIDY